MAEASLYERLGGAFAIAVVVDHFSDAKRTSDCGIFSVAPGAEITDPEDSYSSEGRQCR
jgi:hypothetical protein